MIHSYTIIYEFSKLQQISFLDSSKAIMQLCEHYLLNKNAKYLCIWWSFNWKTFNAIFMKTRQMIIYKPVAKPLWYPSAITVYLMIYWLIRTDNSLPKDIKKSLSREDQCNLFVTSVETETYLENTAVELNLYGQDKD